MPEAAEACRLAAGDTCTGPQSRCTAGTEVRGRARSPDHVRALLVLEREAMELGVGQVHCQQRWRALEPWGDGCADLGGTRRPTLLRGEVQGGQVGTDSGPRKVLGQQVCGVGGPADFVEREVTST